MSQDRQNAGFDPLAATPRVEDEVVQWPILARLPWVGESDEESPSPRPPAPAEILPFADAKPRTFQAPAFDSEVSEEVEIGEQSIPQATPLRVVDAGEPPFRDVSVEEKVNERSAEDRRRPQPAPRSAVAAGDSDESRASHHRSSQPRYRVDPPQPRFEQGLALHQPQETFAAQLYRWQSARRSQAAAIGMSLLLLAVGAIGFFAAGGTITGQDKAADAPHWESQPLPTAGTAIADSLAAPLPPGPPLDLSIGTPVDAATPNVEEPPAPITEHSGEEDPIAQWLREQPVTIERTASKDSANAPAATPAATELRKPVVELQPADVPTSDVAAPPTPALPTATEMAPHITPTATSQAPVLVDPYPTTPYPAFPTSVTLAPAISDGVGFYPPATSLGAPPLPR